MTTMNGRQASHPIDEMFLQRWSPRAFTQEELPSDTLLTILEAARWAPSSFNSQPWRFVYARRNGPGWPQLLSLLIPFNQAWAKNSAALVLIYSKLRVKASGSENDRALRSHAFDAGAAWSNMALQATLMGWHCHGMLGFDHEAALSVFSVPGNYRAEAAIAIGRLGDKALLDEKLAAREIPSQRLFLAEIAAEGRFPS